MLLSHALRAVQKTTGIQVTYQQNAVATNNAASYTFSNQNIGTAFTGRIVVVGVASQGANISSITIGGNSATEINKNGSGGVTSCKLFALQVDTGTTADIVVTMAATAGSCGIAVWTLANAVGYLTEVTPNADNSGSGAVTVTVTLATVNSGDAIIVMNRMLSGMAGTVTFTGVTENFDRLVESGSSAMSGGSTNISTNASNYDVSMTTTAGTRSWAYTVTRFYK
jgi:hypothetical protein